MLNTAELLLFRHLPQRPEDYKVMKLQGGISSEIYKVEHVNVTGGAQEPVVFTVFRDPSDWWKVEKEVELRQMVQNDNEVPLPKLFDAGFDTLQGQQFAYLMREFIAGEDLHTVLESKLQGEGRDSNIKVLAQDLGHRFAALHRHNASIYGMIGGNKHTQYQTWENFVMQQMADEIRLLEQLPEGSKIGRVRVGNINELVPQLEQLVGSNQSSLSEINSPALSHGDAHLANVIANSDEQGKWRVNSFIDWEAATGGDPEIDVSFIENWLYIFPYKDELYNHAGAFKKGYAELKQPSDRYSQRRLIYHAFRSLSYLRTVLGFNSDEFLSTHPRGEMYVDRHMQILESLSNGNMLEDIKLSPLI